MSTLWSFGQGLNFELTMQSYDAFLIYTSVCVQKSRKVCFGYLYFYLSCVFACTIPPPVGNRIRLCGDK